MKTVKDLVIIKDVNPAEVFTENGSSQILALITNEVNSFVLDVNTVQGRKDITSLAYKVSQSKTYLDDLGKNLVADWKAKVATVDNIRKKIRDHMDELRDGIKAPLVEWENNEKKRIEKHKHNLAQFDCAANCINLTSQQIHQRIEFISKIVIDDSWEEFKIDAEVLKEKTLNTIKSAYAYQYQHEKQQEELERIKKEKAELEAKQRSEAMERERLEKERIEAKNKADREENERKISAEKERLALIREKELAEKRARDAEEAKLLAEKREKEQNEYFIRKQEQIKRETEERLAREKQEAEEMRIKEENIRIRLAQQKQEKIASIECALLNLMDRNASTREIAEWIYNDFYA